MECQHIKDELVKFIDNEVSEEIRKSIQSHLDNCAECSQELRSIINITKLCQNWKDISPSRTWKMKLRRKLEISQKDYANELEMIKNAVISMSRKIQELENSNYLSALESGIMTIEELSQYLRLSIDQIYDMIDYIPKFQIGYEYRFRKENIDRWIRALEGKSQHYGFLGDDWASEE